MDEERSNNEQQETISRLERMLVEKNETIKSLQANELLLLRELTPYLLMERNGYREREQRE